MSTSSPTFAVPVTNAAVSQKPNGDIIQLPYGSGHLNFPAGREFSIDGTQIPEPTISGINLWQIATPGATGYIQLNTSGTPSVQTAATILSSALPVSDATFQIKGSSDATKLIRLEVDGNTTGTTRVYTVPNYNGTLATVAGTEAFTGGKTYNGMSLIVGTASGTTDTPAETEIPSAVNSFKHIKVGWGSTSGGITFRTSGPTDLTLPTSGIVATVGRQVKTTADSTVASASTLALGSATGILYDITGTATITSITGIANGEERILRFTSTAKLANNANIIVLGGQDTPAYAGGVATILGKGSGVVSVTSYAKDSDDRRKRADFDGGSILNLNSFSLKSNSASYSMNVVNSDVFTADRELSFYTYDHDRSIQLNGDLVLTTGGLLVNGSAGGLTLTLSGATSLTLPTSGTLATLSGGTFTGQIVGRTGGTGAGTAPIKLVSGSLNTTAEAGAIEFLTDAFYVTQTTGPTRKSIVLAPSAGPVTIAGPTAARTITVPDANFTAARTDAANTFTGTQVVSAIDGGSAANDDITIQGTSNSTRTSSYVLIQPTAGKVGIHASSPGAALHINSTATSEIGLILGGTDALGLGSGTTTGVSFRIGVNLTGNKQFWVGDATDAGSSSEWSLRWLVGSNYKVPNIDAIKNDGSSSGSMNLGDNGGANVGIGFTPSTVVQADITEKLQVVGNLRISGVYKVGGNQVVGARDTGFAAMTGTPNEGTVYDTGTVTLPQLAARVAALQAALTTHGLIGP